MNEKLQEKGRAPGGHYILIRKAYNEGEMKILILIAVSVPYSTGVILTWWVHHSQYLYSVQ